MFTRNLYHLKTFIHAIQGSVKMSGEDFRRIWHLYISSPTSPAVICLYSRNMSKTCCLLAPWPHFTPLPPRYQTSESFGRPSLTSWHKIGLAHWHCVCTISPPWKYSKWWEDDARLSNRWRLLDFKVWHDTFGVTFGRDWLFNSGFSEARKAFTGQ